MSCGGVDSDDVDVFAATSMSSDCCRKLTVALPNLFC